MQTSRRRVLTPSLRCCLAKKHPFYCAIPFEPGGCTLMGNVLAASEAFATKLGR